MYRVKFNDVLMVVTLDYSFFHQHFDFRNLKNDIFHLEDRLYREYRIGCRISTFGSKSIQGLHYTDILGADVNGFFYFGSLQMGKSIILL